MTRRATPDEPSRRRSRYVAACQQLLVLAAVGGVLIPAADVVNLDVVHDPAMRTQGAEIGLAAATGASAVVVGIAQAAGDALGGDQGREPVGVGVAHQHQ